MNIVSFLAPRPEHPFFQDYTPFLDLLRLSCERRGYRHIVLTDDATVGKDGDAYVVPDLPRPLMRAFITAQLAYLSDPQFANEPTLFTGSDCVLAQDLTAFEYYAADADIVITTDDRFTDCRMNMGAMYLPRPATLAPVWADALANMGEEWGDDQRAVYGALKRSGVRIQELPCDPYNLAPENPEDDCRRGYVLHFRGPRKNWMVDYCHHWLGLGDGMQMKLAPNTDDAVAIANVKANFATPHDVVTALGENEGVAVLVGSGPSAEDDIDLIRAMASSGATLFGMNGSVRWLAERRLLPDYGVILDMRPDNARFVRDVIPLNGWLIASHCDPEVVSAARRAVLFHFANPALLPHIPDGATLIGGGPTVGLTAMPLAFALGFRRFHLFGYDSSYAAGQTHLAPQPMTDAEAVRMTVFHGGREFVTGPGMYGQATAFPAVCAAMLEADPDVEIVVHGAGLLPTIAHNMIHPPEAAQAA